MWRTDEWSGKEFVLTSRSRVLLQKLIVTQLTQPVKKLAVFMEPEGSLPRSQQPATGSRKMKFKLSTPKKFWASVCMKHRRTAEGTAKFCGTVVCWILRSMYLLLLVNYDCSRQMDHFLGWGFWKVLCISEQPHR